MADRPVTGQQLLAPTKGKSKGGGKPLTLIGWAKGKGSIDWW